MNPTETAKNKELSLKVSNMSMTHFKKLSKNGNTMTIINRNFGNQKAEVSQFRINKETQT